MARRRAWLLIVLALWLGGCGWGVVDPGERAVFARWGKVEPQCYKEGLYFYNPFTTNMYEIDAKVQAFKLEKLTAASRDLQDVHADIVVNFAIDGDQCHELLRVVGEDFKVRVIAPAVSEVLKASTAHFAVEKIIQERPRLKEEILKGLRGRLTPYFITVNDVSLTDFGFSQEFSKAIERKQIEEQNIQRAEFLRLQAVKEAERQIALADGQAKANILIRQSINSDLLQFEALRKWNGVLPQVTSGAVPFITIEKPK